MREASADAEIAIKRIVDYTGLPKNFVLLEAKIGNAAATIVGKERVILYDPSIIGRSDWLALGIIAHEVGHHLAGHTLRTPGRHQDELEADRFAGFLLARMGATGSQAEQMMEKIANRRASRTHPARSDRVEAVKAGWSTASGQTDRPSQSIDPGPLPAGVPVEYIYHHDTRYRGLEVYRGVVIRLVWERAARVGVAAEIELDLDGPGRRTFVVEQQGLTKVAENHLGIVAREGRRIEIEEATCGSGGFSSVSRIKVLGPR